MSLNEIETKGKISFDNYKLSKSVNRSIFVESFEYHINRLMLPFLNSGGLLFTKYERFSYSDYISLVQSSLEDSFLIEENPPKNYDLDEIDKKVEYIIGKINANDDYTKSHKSIKKFIEDSVSYFFIYDTMFPGSKFNPFLPLMFIFSRGILLGISDNESEIGSISQSTLKRFKNSRRTNLCLIAKGSKNRINSYVLNDSFQNQIKVIKYLKENNIGYTLPEPFESILNKLQSSHINNSRDFENRIVLPLKRTGVVGSTLNQLFFISTKDDLIESEKFQNIKRIMDTDVLNVIQAKKQKWKIINKYLTDKDISEIDSAYNLFIQKENYLEKFEKRNRNYSVALSVLNNMLNDEKNENFEDNFDLLVGGKNDTNRLLSSNGLYRSKSHIVQEKFSFMKVLRNIYSHKSEKISDVYKLYLKTNTIRGFGVNLITELLHTMDIQKFPVFNGNIKLALRIFKIYYFSSGLTENNYEKLYFILSELKEKYNFNDFGQIDIFMNFVYRNYNDFKNSIA